MSDGWTNEALQRDPGGYRKWQKQERERAEEEPERAEPRPDAPSAQESVQRPWWRRWFGG
jgi:hypothetical protein